MSADIIPVPTEGSAHPGTKCHTIGACDYGIMSADIILTHLCVCAGAKRSAQSLSSQSADTIGSEFDKEIRYKGAR
ncbi:hypothetical protein HNQ56_000845 [Anaerotaenia torta]